MLVTLPLDWLYSYWAPEPKPPQPDTWWQIIMEFILTLRDQLTTAFHNLVVYMLYTVLPAITQAISHIITQTMQAMYTVCEILHLYFFPWVIQTGKHIFHGVQGLMFVLWEYFLHATCFTGIQLHSALEYSKALFMQMFEYSKELSTGISECSKELLTKTRDFTFIYTDLIWNKIKQYTYLGYLYFARIPPVKLGCLGVLLALMILCLVVLIQLCKNRKKYLKGVEEIATTSQDVSVITTNGHQREAREDVSGSITSCNGDSSLNASTAIDKKHGKYYQNDDLLIQILH